MTKRPKKPKFTRLIMLSGGIDSTFLLAQALRETEDLVLVHHVHLINLEGRHRAEAHACKNIVEYCRRNYRDFVYTESTVDRSGLYAMGYDVITVASEAGIAATNHLLETGGMADFWMLGFNLEEAHDAEEENDEVGLSASGDQAAQRPATNRLPYILAAIAATCFPNAPPKYLRPILQPKRELMDYMGQDLVDLCWTCRRPVRTDQGFHECGECKTCKLMISIRDNKS